MPCRTRFGDPANRREGFTTTQAGEIPGVAGSFRIGASAGLGLPNIGSVFEVSGSVTVTFNTTKATQTFNMPDSFLPLLHEGEARSINIFKAKPRLDGTEEVASPDSDDEFACSEAARAITRAITRAMAAESSGWASTDITAASSRGSRSIASF